MVFNEKFKMNGNFDYSLKDQSYLPSATSLTLIASGKEVGTVTVDLASYIGQKSKTERAQIGPKRAQAIHSYSDEKVLMADPEAGAEYKNACIIFKITADDTVDEIKTPA